MKVSMRFLPLAMAMAFLIVAELLTSRTPAAQTRMSVAEKFLIEGREAVSGGEYVVAREKLAESLRLDRSVGALLNLALSEEHLGKVASAWLLFRELLNLAPADDERRGKV